jgi:bacterioferritin
LHEKVEHRAIDEMKHAEKLIARLLFLEGRPIVSKLNEIRIGPDVKSQLANDLAAELEAQREYNRAIRDAVEVGDNGSRELLESILKDEEDHVDWLEAQHDQIGQYGLDNYLANQIFKE